MIAAAAYSGGVGAVLVPLVVIVGAALYFVLLDVFDHSERRRVERIARAAVQSVCPMCGGSFIDHGDWVSCEACEWDNAWW